MNGRVRGPRLGAVSAVPPSSRRRRPALRGGAQGFACGGFPQGGFPRGGTHGVPDVRDGLTRVERIVLVALEELQRESPNRGVKAATLYGRVVERVSLSEPEFLQVLTRLLGPRS